MKIAFPDRQPGFDKSVDVFVPAAVAIALVCELSATGATTLLVCGVFVTTFPLFDLQSVSSTALLEIVTMLLSVSLEAANIKSAGLSNNCTGGEIVLFSSPTSFWTLRLLFSLDCIEGMLTALPKVDSSAKLTAVDSKGVITCGATIVAASVASTSTAAVDDVNAVLDPSITECFWISFTLFEFGFGVEACSALLAIEVLLCACIGVGVCEGADASPCRGVSLEVGKNGAALARS